VRPTPFDHLAKGPFPSCRSASIKGRRSRGFRPWSISTPRPYEGGGGNGCRLLDWLRLTWSLGCTGVFAAQNAAHRLDRPVGRSPHSRFMLVWGMPDRSARRARGIRHRGRHWPLPRPAATMALRVLLQGEQGPMAAFHLAQAALRAANAPARFSPAGSARHSQRNGLERWVLCAPK